MTTFAILLPPRFANRFHILLILLSLTPGMIGCRQIIESTTQFTRQTTKIEAIAQQRQVGSKIYIEGTVANLAPFVGAGAYQLQDSTATQPLPSVGEQMLIRGQVNYEQITVEGLPGLDIGDFYIQELERITDNQ
ncbi:hypothetical protein B9S53_02270 [Arthrospira sp. O9.13F]|nr:hypothetical protein B9S53_02270 [Arthrospira sp. O9.13F]